MEEEQLRNELLSLIERLKTEDTLELKKQVSDCLYSLLLINPTSIEYNGMIKYLTDDDILKYINYALDNRDSFPDFTINKFDLTFEGNLYKTHKEEVEKIYRKVVDLYENDKLFVTAKYSFTNCAFMTINPLLPIKKDLSIINKIFILNYEYLKEYVDEIIDYCNEQHHIFTKEDENFVDLVNDPEKILTRLTIDKSLARKLLSLIKGNIKYLNLLLDLHPDYLVDQTIRIDAHNVSEEELFALLKRIRDTGCNCYIEIDTPKVDDESIDKLVAIAGDNIEIKPTNKNSGMTSKRYTPQEMKKKNEILDLYAKTLSDQKGPNGEVKSLSPFEKFVAAYIITTNFASYSDTGKTGTESRSIYEFIDIMVNRPIVCVGYVGFLDEILSRNGFDFIGHKWVQTKGKKTILSANHDVLYTYLKDDKYGIDGFYISDPTNDSIGKDEVPGGKRLSRCLKSYDELLEWTDEYDNPERDMEISEERINRLGREKNVPNLFDKFRGKIPIDAFIKALCAIHRFTDKNLPMAQTNDVSETGYTVEEYNRAALSIDEYDYFIFEESLFDKSYKELYNYFKDTYNLEHYGALGLMGRMLDKYGLDKYINLVFGEKVEFYYDFQVIDLKTYKEEDYERVYKYFGESSFTNFPMMRVKLVDFNLDDPFNTALTLKTLDLNKIKEEYKSKADGVAKGIIK